MPARVASAMRPVSTSWLIRPDVLRMRQAPFARTRTTIMHAQKIIYVLGLGHSGSTVLDMLLTTGGKAVGLGQVWTVLGKISP